MGRGRLQMYSSGDLTEKSDNTLPEIEGMSTSVLLQPKRAKYTTDQPNAEFQETESTSTPSKAEHLPFKSSNPSTTPRIDYFEELDLIGEQNRNISDKVTNSNQTETQDLAPRTEERTKKDDITETFSEIIHSQKVSENTTENANLISSATTSERIPRPRILEPTFIFTTENPTRTSREIVSPTNQTVLESHYFKLTEYYDLQDIEEQGEHQSGQPDIDIEVSMPITSNIENLFYTAEQETESASANTEDLTEVINVSNITELDRMPRDNDGISEGAYEGPYQRLKSQYGGWENSAANLQFCTFFVIITIAVIRI